MEIIKIHVTVQDHGKTFQLIESRPTEPQFLNEYHRYKYRSKPGPKPFRPVFGMLWGPDEDHLGYTAFSTPKGNPVHSLAGGSRQFWKAIKAARFMEFRTTKTK